MISLYQHQRVGARFLAGQPYALLADEMGVGKTRQALVAAGELFVKKVIDRALVLCPATVRYAWGEEIGKLMLEGLGLSLGSYNADKQELYLTSHGGTLDPHQPHLPIAIVSYGLLPKAHHVKALRRWCAAGDTLLICDESSFLKSSEAQTTQGALELRAGCRRCWLLTGTPIANSPLDLWSQAEVMAGGRHGPLAGFKNFYHFRASYGVMGGYKGKEWFPDREKLPGLRERFKPFVLRREKVDCLDLPPKTYTVREVALTPTTWRVYQELRREALLALPDMDVKPEPHAAVRLMRLCQLTSGHVGSALSGQELRVGVEDENPRDLTTDVQDVSHEKLSWMAEAILDGELADERALIVWCRWRRERERLAQILRDKAVPVFEVFGGQSQTRRNEEIANFQNCTRQEKGYDPPPMHVLVAQPHAGGYGLTLTAAATAIYLSNDYSYITRVQSEDRCHRIGQTRPVTYVDVLATGPRNERTVDHAILKALKAKEDLARWTCAAWRRALE